MTTETNENESPWFIDENIPGVGPRPDWLPDKFKSVADLSKSYAELEKKVGVAPEDYDFSKSRYLDPDYVPFQELKKVAKDKRVPQEVMDKVIESVDKYFDEFRHDPEEVFKELGDNAKERVKLLDNWAKANLSQAAYEGLTNNLRTADAIKGLEELRGKMMSNSTVVPNGNGDIPEAKTVEDLKTELSENFQKYKDDANYRKDYQARLAVAAKNSPGYVDKVGA